MCLYAIYSLYEAKKLTQIDQLVNVSLLSPALYEAPIDQSQIIFVAKSCASDGYNLFLISFISRCLDNAFRGHGMRKQLAVMQPLRFNGVAFFCLHKARSVF